MVQKLGGVFKLLDPKEVFGQKQILLQKIFFIQKV